MCQKLNKTTLGECPLSQNRWAENQEEFPLDTEGFLTIHRSGAWDFQAVVEKEAVKVFAAYIDGEPRNFSEFLGVVEEVATPK